MMALTIIVLQLFVAGIAILGVGFLYDGFFYKGFGLGLLASVIIVFLCKKNIIEDALEQHSNQKVGQE